MTHRRLQHRSSWIIVALVSALGCADSGVLEPSGIAEFRQAGGSTRISAMTRNLYIGTDVDRVIAALASPDPTDDLAALLDAVATIQRTAFPLRAQALADEIATHRPHFIGLQEVTQLSIQLPPLGINLQADFLPILQAALAQRGLHYAVAAQVDGAQADLQPFPGGTITLRDHDALLVDTDQVTVDPASVVEQLFAANLGQVLPGVILNRGYVALTADVAGLTVRVASTHLESGNNPPNLNLLRAAQAQELVAALGTAPRAIVLGDLNDGPGTPMYQVVTGAGLSDSWGEMRPGASGFTCCHVADLSNPVSQMNQRIDYVLVRGLGGPNGKLLGQVTITGTTPGDQVAGPSYPLWPSDHAGLAAVLLLPPPVLAVRP